MKRKLKGSYTVEAAFVMSMVLWAMLCTIQAAFYLRDEVTGSMALQESVQRLRHNESEDPKEAENWALKRAGESFSWKKYRYELQLSGNALTGKKVKAEGAGGSWKLLIEQDIFDPENFLRMLTLLDQEE